MSVERVFVDTNVLAYSYDVNAGRKHEAARAALQELWTSRRGVISTQVLQEFYVTATRKLSKSLSKSRAREIIITYRAWTVHQPHLDDIVAASELEERHKLSFWDALVVTSAHRLGAGTLLSEDLQHGRRFGELVVQSPFAELSDDA